MSGAAQALLSASGSGGGAPRVSISDQALSAAGPGTVSTGYNLDNDGKAYRTGTTTGLLESWLLSGSAFNYQARATVTSGSLTSGTVGAWLTLGVDQQWVVSAARIEGHCTLLVEIRDASSLTVLDSAVVTLTANPS